MMKSCSIRGCQSCGVIDYVMSWLRGWRIVIALLQASHAASLGADAIACMSPVYFKPQTEGTFNHSIFSGVKWKDYPIFQL